MHQVMSPTEFITIIILLLLPILYEHSHTFRYYLKFVIYYGLIMLTSVLVIPIMIWKPRNVENLMLVY